MGIFNAFKRKGATATIPSAAVLYKFRALKDFWSDAFQSQYVVNGVYSVRQGNEKLAEAVVQWIPQGKVEIL